MENQEVETVELDVDFEPELVEESEINQNGFEIAMGLLGEIFFDLALVVGEEAVAAIKKELYEQYAGQEDVDEKAQVARSIYNACSLCEEFYGWDNQPETDG